MKRSPVSNRRSAAAALLVLAGVAGFASVNSTEGYAPAAGPDLLDTLRTKSAETTASPRAHLILGAVVQGYLSARGLPPVHGRFTLSENGLVFRSSEGTEASFPIVGPVRQAGGRQWRPSTISLAYMEESSGRAIYVFRVDAGVFETDDPGVLLEVAAHPEWLDSLAPTEWTAEPPLVNAADSSAARSTARDIATSAFADSLYALFGRPEAPVGLIGPRGRRAGRLGEYIGSRDSLALDPGRMTGKAQLRHAMAHELGHRWQARAPSQITTLWEGVTPIRDPKRYGYGEASEHQAEAIAFAFNFLQTTAQPGGALSSSLTLLDHYELLVPGTRTMVRYFSLQPLYRKHPLRSILTTGRK